MQKCLPGIVSTACVACTIPPMVCFMDVAFIMVTSGFWAIDSLLIVESLFAGNVDLSSEFMPDLTEPPKRKINIHIYRQTCMSTY